MSGHWEALAPRWARGRELLWRGTRPVSEWLVERLGPQPGQTVLDLAAGTGDTGFLAAPRLEPDGRLITADRESGMVEAARQHAEGLGVTNVDFRVLDAERLDLPDASVDGVLNRFGYILRGNPPPTLLEIRRVLRPGGRLAFAVWAARELNPWMTVPADVMVERGHLSPPDDAERRLSARRNPDSISLLLAEAGFGAPEIEELPVAYRFRDPEELWIFVSELRGPVALALAALPDDERGEIRREVERRTPRAGDGFELGGISVNVVVS
jgi:ubiquinone/menaquinone biosynthesis C-methylase UbiE